MNQSIAVRKLLNGGDVFAVPSGKNLNAMPAPSEFLRHVGNVDVLTSGVRPAWLSQGRSVLANYSDVHNAASSVCLGRAKSVIKVLPTALCNTRSQSLAKRSML